MSFTDVHTLYTAVSTATLCTIVSRRAGGLVKRLCWWFAGSSRSETTAGIPQTLQTSLHSIHRSVHCNPVHPLHSIHHSVHCNPVHPLHSIHHSVHCNPVHPIHSIHHSVHCNPVHPLHTIHRSVHCNPVHPLHSIHHSVHCSPVHPLHTIHHSVHCNPVHHRQRPKCRRASWRLCWWFAGSSRSSERRGCSSRTGSRGRSPRPTTRCPPARNGLSTA